MEPISVLEFIEEESNWFSNHWMEILVLAWTLGLIWQLTRLSIGLKTIYSIMHKKGIETIHLEHGVTLYLTAESISSFSWMNSIVMSADDYAENGETILVHEQAHIAARHSLDKLLLLGVQAIQWWNPFVWILGDSLYQVHEYEADQAVIQSGIHATQYQLLLISKAAGPAELAMVNGFKFNNLKNRIIMMNKKDQTRIAWARYLALAPMLLVAFAVSANSNRPLPEDPQPHLEIVVEEDGSITDIKCLRSPHQTFTDEAIRIVGLMPKWEPASRQGKALRSNHYLQVIFN